MQTISFIYEASKLAFLQEESDIFFVSEFVKMKEIVLEFTKTMPSIIRQRKIIHRDFVEIEKIRLRVHKFLNILDFELVR